MMAVETTKKARFTKWVPKRWKPEYEQVVLLSINATNKEIAALTNYTPQQISNILNTPQAIEIKDQLILKMREKAVTDSPIARLDRIRDKALVRLEEALANDTLMEKSPFALIDRGLKVIEGLGHLNTKSAQQGTNNNFNGPVMILPSEAANQLAKGLDLANQVRARSEGRLLNPVEVKDDSSNK